MRSKHCKIKNLDFDWRLRIGTLEDIAVKGGNRGIVLERLYMLPNLNNVVVKVSNPKDEVLSTLVEMCVRVSCKHRDTMGNLPNSSVPWQTFMYKALTLIGGEHAEDLLTGMWEHMEVLLTKVFMSVPFYALAGIYYSVLTREIVFVSDFANACNQQVLMTNQAYHHTTDSIVGMVQRDLAFHQGW